MNYDVFLVGVGGQGILTIGEILSGIAAQKGVPVNFFPSRGMAQRGGFVKAQLRLGREHVGPTIPEHGADLVIAMERSEALKAIPYTRPGTDFFLFGEVWPPTAVTLGKAPYPTLEAVQMAIRAAQARLSYIPTEALPKYQGRLVQANIFLLGAVLHGSELNKIINHAQILSSIAARWPAAADENRFAFEAGSAYTPESGESPAAPGNPRA
jgi:indolepyruvate ferredoxin oxidoreductase, beta subunit